MVSRFVFPLSSSNELSKSIKSIFSALNHYLQFKLKTLKKNEAYHPPLNEHIYIKMVERLSKAKTEVRQLSYERYFKRALPYDNYSKELKLLTIIAHSIYSIIGIDETIEKRLNHEDRLFTLEFIEQNIMPQWNQLVALYEPIESNARLSPPLKNTTKKHLISLNDFLAFYQQRGYRLEHPVLLSGLHYYLRKLLRAINSLLELKQPSS
jgi:hypothetical protein